MRSGWRAGLMAALVLAGSAQADEEVINYVAYDETFSSGGGVTAEALERLRDSGLERVIFLAYTDQEQSLANEDRVVPDVVGRVRKALAVRKELEAVWLRNACLLPEQVACLSVEARESERLISIIAADDAARVVHRSGDAVRS